MTNELGTTLHDIEAKAERKREAFGALDFIEEQSYKPEYRQKSIDNQLETIRKYIEEN